MEAMHSDGCRGPPGRLGTDRSGPVEATERYLGWLKAWGSIPEAWGFGSRDRAMLQLAENLTSIPERSLQSLVLCSSASMHLIKIMNI